MNLPHDDKGALELCVYREARSLGYRGMLAVACVIKNRSTKRKQTIAQVVYSPWQFSSMSDPRDPQLHMPIPSAKDPQWGEAQDIAASIIANGIVDITGNALEYYADYIPRPHWDWSKLKATVTIGNTHFFSEVV